MGIDLELLTDPISLATRRGSDNIQDLQLLFMGICINWNVLFTSKFIYNSNKKQNLEVDVKHSYKARS